MRTEDISVAAENAPASLSRATTVWCELGAPNFTRLLAVMHAELRDNAVPGASLGLLQRGRILLAKNLGVTDRETRAPVTERTVFQLGSVSKFITAIAVVLLAERGEIDLHAPIGRYSQWLEADLGALTAHQLLTHTAGLKDGGALYGSRTELDLRGSLADWGRELMFTCPGEVFSYSNPGYSLVGLLVESVTARTFAEALRELVFAPLAMQDSAVGAHVATDSACSAGHARARDGSVRAVRLLADNVAYRPAGYICSTSQDLGRLLRALLDDGRLDGAQVLPPTLLERVTTMHVTLPGHAQRGYGYGLYVHHSADRRIAVHTGFNAGFGARVCLCPDARGAVIALTNRQAQTLPRSTQAAMDILAPVAIPMNRALSHSKHTPQQAANAQYVGTYAQYGPPVVVHEKAGTLWLRSGGINMSLRPIGTHRFACATSDGEKPIEVVFTERDDSGFRYLYAQSRAFRRSEPGIVDHA